MADDTIEKNVTEPIAGSGKFYFPNDATYEGEWMLYPEEEKEQQEDSSGDREESTADTEGEDREKVECEVDAGEPKGKYVRHGKGKYIEGDYSYEGNWTNVSLKLLY